MPSNWWIVVLIVGGLAAVVIETYRLAFSRGFRVGMTGKHARLNSLPAAFHLGGSTWKLMDDGAADVEPSAARNPLVTFSQRGSRLVGELAISNGENCALEGLVSGPRVSLHFLSEDRLVGSCLLGKSSNEEDFDLVGMRVQWTPGGQLTFRTIRLRRVKSNKPSTGQVNMAAPKNSDASDSTAEPKT